MKHTTIIANDRDCYIELLHRTSDPGTWIVRRATKFLWFKKRLSSDRFINGRQALEYAQAMKRQYTGQYHTARESDPGYRSTSSGEAGRGGRSQSDDQERWQDDGGESGEVV